MNFKLSAVRLALLALAALMLAFPGGACAAAYLDAGLKDLRPEDRVVIASPQPVQLVFMSQSKGKPDGNGTRYLKDSVVAAVKASGLFSQVGEKPVESGAVLNVVINDLLDPKAMQEEEGKLFYGGPALLIIGATVHEDFISTVDYVSGSSAAKITRSSARRCYFQLGLINETPDKVEKFAGAKEAMFAMARQAVANALNEIGRDPAFPGHPGPGTGAVAAQPPAP